MYMNDPNDGKLAPTNNLIDDGGMGGKPGSATNVLDPYEVYTHIEDSGLQSIQDFRGLLTGVKWSAHNLNYSFPTSANQYGTGYYDQNSITDGFAALTSGQQAIAKRVFDSVAGFTQLTFTQTTASATNIAQLRFAQSDYPSTAYAYYPSSSSAGGDIFLGPDVADTPTAGNWSWFTIAHEIGHALGLKHGHDSDGGIFDVLPYDKDTNEYSIMTYRTALGGITDYTTFADGSAALSFMASDILALQYMYGANYQYHAEDTVYHWSPDSSTITINGVGRTGSNTNVIFETVWDGAGNDTYDFSDYSDDLMINLAPGAWTVLSSEQQALLAEYSSSGENARGNVYNAFLFAGNTSSLIENALGGSGNDQFVGNVANNRFEGGMGDDLFTTTAGDDYFSGGTGVDTLNIAGFTVDHVVNSVNTGETTIFFDDGNTLTVVDVEQVQFDNGEVQDISVLGGTVDTDVTLTLFNDTGIASDDNITNDKRFQLSGYDLDAGDITYTLKSISKTGVEKIVGKADSLLAGIDEEGVFVVPTKAKTGLVDGTYTLSVNQDGTIATLESFTIDTKVPANLSVSLLNDTGKKGDKVTADATLKVTGLEKDAVIEYRLKADSESDPIGSDWMVVSDDWLSVGKSTLIDLNQFYIELENVGFENDGSGWQDKFEFRQMDVAGNVSKKTTSLDITYDALDPSYSLIEIGGDEVIKNGAKGSIRVMTIEKLVGFDKQDFILSNKLASITGVTEKKLGDDLWAYDIGIKAASKGSGDIDLSFSTKLAATDLAGNAVDFSDWSDTTYSMWIGSL